MTERVKSPRQTWDDEPKSSHKPLNIEVLARINEALLSAEDHKLQAEVMWSTINFILLDIEQGKKPIDVNICETLEAALQEWDI